MNFTFIILHYKVADATVACVDSIQSLQKEKNDNVHIIIVDNFSNNGSGEFLKNKYADVPEVEVYFTDENLGFAKGNNFGYSIAKSEYCNDYIIACNNDTVISDTFFLQKVKIAHMETGFNILGPDILNPRTREHQSPCGSGLNSLADVDVLLRRCIKQKEAFTNPTFENRLFFLIRDSRIGEAIVNLKHRCSFLEKSRPWDVMQTGVVLHGSFLIFDKKYIDQMPWLFSPCTFMYLEENFLHLNAKAMNYKLVYYPQLQIEHWHGVSTSVGRTKWSDKQKFFYENVISSLKQYRNYLSDFLNHRYSIKDKDER